MSNITLGGPYPKCPVCERGNLVPTPKCEEPRKINDRMPNESAIGKILECRQQNFC